MRAWAFAQVKHRATNDNPFEGDELAALLKQRTDEKYPFGDMPLVVLSRGHDVDDVHTRSQTELVGLSRIGKQITAQRSGHEIMITEPGLVVRAIRDVMSAVLK